MPIRVNFRNCDIGADIRMNNRIQRDNGGTIQEERKKGYKIRLREYSS